MAPLAPSVPLYGLAASGARGPFCEHTCNTTGNFVSAAVAKTTNPASANALKVPLSLAFCQGTGLPNSVSIRLIQAIGYDISPLITGPFRKIADCELPT